MDNITNIVTGSPLEARPLNVWGLVCIIIFYLLILGMGIWATFRNKAHRSSNVEEMMLAGRTVGSVVGVFTMTATWVGGGFINGTAEYVFTPGYGLAWTQAVWGYSFSLVIGGIFFAKPMRQAGYVTMLDPFRAKYGRVVAAFMIIPPLLGELFYTGAILSALGATLSVILAVSHHAAVAISAAIAVLYTVLGGLYSVVFTDIVQIFCIFIGLWLCAGFALANPVVADISSTAFGPDGWIGNLHNDASIGIWIDLTLLLIFGGIPIQAYFQRVLAARTARSAQVLSFCGAFGCIFLSIPAILIGAAAKSADWNATDYSRYFELPVEQANYPLILPLSLQYLTPLPVAVIGLGAVSAAVMSSADSALLSSSSMFARNIYGPIRNAIYRQRPCGDRETVWVMRGSIIVLGVLATTIAIQVGSIYALFVLCGDFVYTVAFPQLVCVIHLKWANSYGALFGYFLSFILRLMSGEPLLSFPPLIKFWHYDEMYQTQQFPFRTFIMLLSLLSIILVSYVTKAFLPHKWDFLQALKENDDDDENDDGGNANRTLEELRDAQYSKELVNKWNINGSPSHKSDINLINPNVVNATHL